MNIEEWDAEGASDEELGAAYELSVRQQALEEPEDPAPPYAEWLLDLKRVPPWVKVRRWRALDPSGRLAGMAWLYCESTETNQNLADFRAFVDPEFRGQGIAKQLLRPVAAAAADAGRTLLNVQAIDGSEGDTFVTALGAEKKLVERKSRLALADVDRAQLEGWVARAQERAGEYRIIQWDNRIPDDDLDRFLRIVEVMNTAPRDDLEMEDWKQTPERFREWEARRNDMGFTRWTVVAEHQSGELAGYTDLTFPGYAPHMGWQGGTATDPKHRNKGLGRWMKAVNCLRVLDERPEVAYIDTGNAFSNDAMLGINIAMGFQLVRGYAEFQIPTDVLAKALQSL